MQMMRALMSSLSMRARTDCNTTVRGDNASRQHAAKVTPSGAREQPGRDRLSNRRNVSILLTEKQQNSENVRFGSKADIAAMMEKVRFVPTADVRSGSVDLH